MAKPFYLKCECGGELELFPVIARCCKCRNVFNAEETRERYAAALGLAVEALENIQQESDWHIVEDLAFRALLKIKGEEK